MTISSAMQAGVSGLKANSDAVGRISENIANSSTVGYKRTFASMVTNTAGGHSGVRAEYGSEVGREGTTRSSSSATALAMTGNGFFVVSKAPNDPNQANYMLTRAGDFKPDQNGNLVNAAGYFMAGYSYGEDATLNGVDRTSFQSMRTVNVANLELTAQASTAGSISGNLPSGLTGTGTPQSSFVSTMAYYTPLGDRQALSLSWTPSETTDNLWGLEVADPDGTVYGTVDVTFHDSGATPAAPMSYVGTADPGLAAPAGFSVDADGNISLTLANGATPQTLEVALGAVGSYDGITQFAGDYEPQNITMDGSETSALASTEIDERGNVFGVFENGTRRALYQIPVATVDNADGLQLVTGNAYKLTLESGDAVMKIAGTGAGSILAGALEGSNVDIAQEMTDLIQVQRTYSSNAKIITTADEMLQEATNLKR